MLCMLVFVVGIMRRGADGGSIISLSLMVVPALVLLALGPSSFTPILLIVIAAAIAAVYRPRIAVTALVALNLVFLAVLLARWRIADPGFTLFVYGSFEAFALLTTLERARAQRVSRELREVNAQLLATRELLAESARDGERLRVSRELHDVAGHRLTALALNLDLLGQEVRVSARREWLVSRELVSKLLSELRSVVANLRRHDGIDRRYDGSPKHFRRHGFTLTCMRACASKGRTGPLPSCGRDKRDSRTPYDMRMHAISGCP